MHTDLRLAGTLPPLDAPHHMRATEWAFFREGVVTKSILNEGSLLNVGLDKVAADEVILSCITSCCMLGIAAACVVLTCFVHPAVQRVLWMPHLNCFPLLTCSPCV